MGATESKIDPQFLSRFVLDSKRFENDEYWKHLFRSPVTREFLQNHLPIELIRKARQTQNPNLVDFFYKVLDALQEVIDCGHKGNLGGVGCSVARNCLCLLTHILPAFHEIPLPHEISYLQNSDRSRHILSDSSFVYTLFWLTPQETSLKANTASTQNLQKIQLDSVQNPLNQIIEDEEEKGESIDKLKTKVKKAPNLVHQSGKELENSRNNKECLFNYVETTQDCQKNISPSVTDANVSVEKSCSNTQENANILKQLTNGIERTEDNVNQAVCNTENTRDDTNQRHFFVDTTTDDAKETTRCIKKAGDALKEPCCCANKIGDTLEYPCCCTSKTGDASEQPCCCANKTGDASEQPCCCTNKTGDSSEQPCCCTNKTGDSSEQPCCCTNKTGDSSEQPCCCEDITRDASEQPCCCTNKTEDASEQPCCCTNKRGDTLEHPCCCTSKTGDASEQPCCCANKTGDASEQPCCCANKTGDASEQPCCCTNKRGDTLEHPCCCANKTGDVSEHPCCCTNKTGDASTQPCCCTKKIENAEGQPCCFAQKYENTLEGGATEVEKPRSNVKVTEEQLEQVVNKEKQLNIAAKQLDNNSESLVCGDVNHVRDKNVNELNKNFEQLTLIEDSLGVFNKEEEEKKEEEKEEKQEKEEEEEKKKEKDKKEKQEKKEEDKKKEKEKEEKQEEEEEEKEMQPLAIKILSTLQNLLFLKNFTLLIPHVVFPEKYIPPQQKVNTQLLWNGIVGGGKSSSYCKLSNDIYSNRKAVLTCLLVCLSSQVYKSQLMRIKSPPCLWLWFFTQGSMPYIGNLYCSLMSLVFSKTSSSLLGFEFGYSKSSFNYENNLRGIAAKLFCVLINFDIPAKCEIPPETEKLLLLNQDKHPDEMTCVSNLTNEHAKPQFFNIYRLMLAAMKNEKEISAVYDEICLQIKASCGLFHSKFSSPSALTNSCTEEHLLILWNLLISNKTFLQHATQKDSIQKLLVPLLCTMLEASTFLRESIKSEKKHSMEASIVTGVLHLCSLILFVLSAERQFATQANGPFNETFPISFTFFKGSYTDLIILSFYQICTSELMSVENESLIDIFLTTLCNMSPYLRSLCPESSMKLVSLFQRLSQPHWLFEQPYRYRNTFLLLEIFDNIIQYQYTGNYNLIYSILRQKNVFEAFHLLEFSESQKNVPQSSPPNSTLDDIQYETREPTNTPTENHLKALKTSNDAWCATQEWFNTWKAEAPTHTVMCVIDKLIPLVNDLCADDEFPDQTDIIDMIKSTMLVGILPVPPSILIRNYVPHITTNQWFVTFTWRIIALKLRNEFHLPNLLLFNIETTE